LGIAAVRLRDRLSAGGAGIPLRLSAFQCVVPGERLARNVLPRRGAGAPLALHSGEGQGVGHLARAPHRLDDLPPFDISTRAPLRLSRAADDDDEFHLTWDAGHVSDPARDARLLEDR